jgi:ABC-type uncharacterized transport system substrate-binding protein
VRASTPLSKTTIVAVAAAVFGLHCAIALAGNGERHLPRIGVLWPGDVERYNQAFLTALAANGYRNGETAEIQVRGTEGGLDIAPRMAEEIVALEPDVIYAAPGLLAKHVLTAQQKLGKRIPVVVLTWDPVGEGLAASAAHPGGSVTGVAGAHSPGQFITKHFQLLKEIGLRLSESPVSWMWGGTRSSRRNCMLHCLKAAQRLGFGST